MQDTFQGKRKRRIFLFTMLCFAVVSLIGCGIAGLGSKIKDIKGQLVGNSFDCVFYDRNGNKTLTASGTKVGVTGNIVKESKIDASDGSVSEAYGLSEVITISIDGHEIHSCGDTVLFVEKGLKSDMEFELGDISSSSGGLSGLTAVSGIVNQYKNYFGKAVVVVIKSQDSMPICAYSGNDVYWEVAEDLPKTTKFMIDGKALYVHRATFQVIDKVLLE